MSKRSFFLLWILTLSSTAFAAPGGPGVFVNLSGGYDFSFLDAINNGSKLRGVAINSFMMGTDTSAVGNSGIATELDFGYMITKEHGLSIDTSFVLGPDSIGRADDGSATIYQKVTPNLMGVGLSYHFKVDVGGGSKLDLSLGGNWYHTFTDMDYLAPGGDYIKGSFEGDTIGGTLGVAGEISLGGGMAIGIGVKGRMASFDKVTATKLQTNQPLILPSPTGPYTLSIQDANGDTDPELIYEADANVDGSTIKYATVDMSGFQGNLSFILYL